MLGIDANPDLLVIGAGPAGMAAAIEAKKGGLERVLLVDRDDGPGGILKQCVHNGFGLHYFKEDLTGPEYAHKFIQELREMEIPSLSRTMAIDLTSERVVTLCNSRGVFTLQPRSIVLAMGCRERTKEALMIAGGRPSGIFTAGVAQRYVNIEGYLPGENVVILGSGDVGLIMARRMYLEGARVKGVVEVLPYVSGLARNQVQCLEDFNIPLYLKSTITRIFGRERLSGVEVCDVDDQRKPVRGTERIIECDTLLISAGLIPEIELCQKAGIEIDTNTGGPVVNENMETSVPGVFACGNVVHVNNLVDQVTVGGLQAGRGAAQRAQGEQATVAGAIRVLPGKNIRYVTPALISGHRPVSLSLRVSEPMERATIKLGEVARRYRIVMPGDVVEIALSEEEMKSLGVCRDQDVTIDCLPQTHMPVDSLEIEGK